jgi:RNA-directed DNA polymerase
LPILEALRSAKTRHDLAALLGYKPSNLSYIVYVVPKEKKYTTFKIHKKDGGERTIDAPIPMLKKITETTRWHFV